MALMHLGLDAVWWLVSPQNPLKPVAGMAPLADRLAAASAVAHHPRIAVSALERRLGTRYTADTVEQLRRRFPGTRFVWLMGADNLVQIDRWDRWQDIFRAAPIAVFDRPPYCLKALGSVAARRFRRHRLLPGRARRLAATVPPAWLFVPIPRHPGSATQIRARRAAAL